MGQLQREDGAGKRYDEGWRALSAPADTRAENLKARPVSGRPGELEIIEEEAEIVRRILPLTLLAGRRAKSREN